MAHKYIKVIVVFWSLFHNLGCSAISGASTIDSSHRNSDDKYALSEVVVRTKWGLQDLHRMGRRQQSPGQLQNNVPSGNIIGVGDTHFFTFPSSELQRSSPQSQPVVPPWDSTLSSSTSKGSEHQELKRQDQNILYVTLTICGQPNLSKGQTPIVPPSLTLWVSLNDNNKEPGPSSQGQQREVPTTGGRAFFETQKTGDTFIGVSAPRSLKNFTGQWTYQVTASNQAYFSNYFDYPSLRLHDSDLNSTLLVTDSLTNPAKPDSSLVAQWMNTGGPFGLFLYDANDPLMAGINQSFCGLAKYAMPAGNLQSLNTTASETGMKLFNGSLPYQQFYVGRLEPSTSYKAALALTGNYTLKPNDTMIAGGGSVWKSVDLTTRSGDTNCQLIYNLTFCEDVAYSVPTNSSFYGDSKMLGQVYDNYTGGMLWQMFQNSLDQVPCETSPDAKYSLARNCSDCSKAYKNWVCAVSIPRCADFSSSAPFLQARNTAMGSGSFRNGTLPDETSPIIGNVTNMQSRNMNLSSWVNLTGPYKEVLPCDNLCYDLVQSCPSILGFACPWRGRGFEWSYGSVPTGPNVAYVSDGYPACNAPGEVWGLNSAHRSPAPVFLLLTTIFSVLLAFS